MKSVEELADAKALATRLEEQLKQAERQSKPVGGCSAGCAGGYYIVF